MCEPEGMSLQMGGLHPRASLFEKPVNLEAAKTAHAEFRRVMRDKGVKVLTVREILAYGGEDHVGARVALEDFAMEVCRQGTGTVDGGQWGRWMGAVLRQWQTARGGCAAGAQCLWRLEAVAGGGCKRQLGAGPKGALLPCNRRPPSRSKACDSQRG